MKQMDKYPDDSPVFQSLYSPQAIQIDKPVYEALHKKLRPIWRRRDQEQERLDKIRRLNEALSLFLGVCEEENIISFAEYDERFMIHFRSARWVDALCSMIGDEDDAELQKIRQKAYDVFDRFHTDSKD